MKTKMLPLLLLSTFLLGACSNEIHTRPSDYDNPLVVDKGADSLGTDVSNNIAKIIYDAKLDSGTVAKDVLDEVLYQISVSIFGDYKTLSELKFDGTANAATDEFINNHKVYWVLDEEGNRLTDETAKEKERIKVKLTVQRINERIAEEMFNEAKGDSYQRNGYFYETDLLMSLRNSVYDVANPLDEANKAKLHDKYLIVPELKAEDVFTYSDWEDADALDGLLTKEFYTSYIEIKHIPEIYRDLLVEQYLFDSNYSTIGRAYAREVNIISITKRDSAPLLAGNLMNSYIDNFINTDDDELAKKADFDIISKAWRGYNVSTTDKDFNGNEYQQAAALLDDAGAKASTYSDSEGFVGGSVNYWEGTSYGDLYTDLGKVYKDPLKTNTEIENSFTNNGEYTIAQGVQNKTNDIRKEAYVTDGWHIRNGGLSTLNETIRTRLFNIGVANALADENYPDRFAEDGTYSNNPEGENNYVAKIHGKYYLKPVTTERVEEDVRLNDMLWIDKDAGTYTIVEITEAVSSSRLALNSSTNYEATDGFEVMETIAHDVAKEIAKNDSYINLSTQYWLKAASIAYHDDTIYEYFKTNYPDIFEEE